MASLLRVGPLDYSSGVVLPPVPLGPEASPTSGFLADEPPPMCSTVNVGPLMGNIQPNLATTRSSSPLLGNPIDGSLDLGPHAHHGLHLAYTPE